VTPGLLYRTKYINSNHIILFIHQFFLIIYHPTMRNYTLKQIQTFLEVAREKSVSRAAERLFVTQPAVSMQIRQLEEAFGLALIEPQGRNIQLTGAGQEFLTHAIAAMAQLKDIEAIMAEHVGIRKGRIELAVVSTAKYFVPMLLVRFGKLYPGIEVKLHIDNRDNILGLLGRNEVDLVVMGRAPNTLDCEAVSFATNPLGIVSAPDHPLSRRKRLAFEMLKDFDFVVREKGSGTRAAMERLFGQHDIPIKVAMEMPSNETIKQAVMAGMGLHGPIQPLRRPEPDRSRPHQGRKTHSGGLQNEAQIGPRLPGSRCPLRRRVLHRNQCGSQHHRRLHTWCGCAGLHIDEATEDMRIAYPLDLFDRNITDGRMMMVSF
jgi:DNA-binding transcriptional LysR family regulator